MRSVMEYEGKYINAAGYWMAFGEAEIDLHQEVWIQIMSRRLNVLMYGLLYNRGIFYVFWDYVQSFIKWDWTILCMYARCGGRHGKALC